MLSKRYTVVLADRTTGVVRRLTISVKPVVIAIVTVVTLPILIGTGAALKARYDVRDLYASNATLELENANYRAATEQLAGQIMALQTSMSDLGASTAGGQLTGACGDLPVAITGAPQLHPEAMRSPGIACGLQLQPIGPESGA